MTRYETVYPASLTWRPLVFDGNLGNSDVLMTAGSVDQTNTYVFETTPRGVAESASKSLQYWSIGGGDDTMVSVWNPADEPQDFLLTLFFPGGQYALPLHLEARATRSLNISEIVQNQVPDANGNIIPAGTHEGGAVISGVHAENEQIMVAIDSGVYNVKKATCSNYCTNCDGYNNDELIINGFVLPVGSNTQEHLYAQYNSGGQYDFTSSATWSSTATSVATVSTGLVHGQAVGTTSISALAGPVTAQEGYMCFGPNPMPCPPTYVSGNVPGTVYNPQISSVSPSPLTLGVGGILTITGSNFSRLLTPVVKFSDPGISITGNPSVISDSTITVNYLVTCSATVGGSNVKVQDAQTVDGVTPQSNPWPISVSFPTIPQASINFDGQAVTGAVSVFVGQQIPLTSSVPSLPQCTSLTGQSWSVPPFSIMNYTNLAGTSAPDATGAKVTLPASTTNNYTLYFISPGSNSVSFQYTLSGGGSAVSSPASTATFNVTGITVTSNSVNPALGSWQPPTTSLNFGNSTVDGIYVTSTITNNTGRNGVYKWVQIINNFVSYRTGYQNCGPFSGLDTLYPFATGEVWTDSLTRPLPSAATRVESDYTFTDYLLWDPLLTNSVPVPLGSFSWTAKGIANKSSGVWSLDSASTQSKTTFQPSTTYPTWTSTVTGPMVTQQCP